jgi:hypothetical protein
MEASYSGRKASGFDYFIPLFGGVRPPLPFAASHEVRPLILIGPVTVARCESRRLALPGRFPVRRKDSPARDQTEHRADCEGSDQDRV